MKKLITISFLFVQGFAFAQFTPARADLFKKEIDSLCKLYKRDVFGYSHSLVRGTEALIIYYTDNENETQDTIVWLRVIPELKRSSRKRQK